MTLALLITTSHKFLSNFLIASDLVCMQRSFSITQRFVQSEYITEHTENTLRWAGKHARFFDSERWSEINYEKSAIIVSPVVARHFVLEPYSYPLF
jgi:hypothetical protein